MLNFIMVGRLLQNSTMCICIQQCIFIQLQVLRYHSENYTDIYLLHWIIWTYGMFIHSTNRGESPVSLAQFFPPKIIQNGGAE